MKRLWVVLCFFAQMYAVEGYVPEGAGDQVADQDQKNLEKMLHKQEQAAYYGRGQEQYIASQETARRQADTQDVSTSGNTNLGNMLSMDSFDTERSFDLTEQEIEDSDFVAPILQDMLRQKFDVARIHQFLGASTRYAQFVSHWSNKLVSMLDKQKLTAQQFAQVMHGMTNNMKKRIIKKINHFIKKQFASFTSDMFLAADGEFTHYLKTELTFDGPASGTKIRKQVVVGR